MTSRTHTSTRTNGTIAKSKRRRIRVSGRDQGFCAQCGRDCKAEAYRIRKHSGRALARTLADMGINAQILAHDLWTVDHIVPLSRGGADIMRNTQTLCFWCHTDKTTAERGKT